MDKTLERLFNDIQSSTANKFEHALLDLRYIVERHTMNRYDDSEKEVYRKSFNDAALVNFKLSQEDYVVVKYFLFYALLNFPDRAVLTAKCIKVLFDIDSIEAVCNSIEFFLSNDDDTAVELLYALIDQDEFGKRFQNNRIISLYQKIIEYGGEQAKTVVKDDLSLFGFQSISAKT